MAEQKLLVKREGDFHYPIYFKNDFQDLAGAIREEGLENRKICIVTDSHVAPLYHEAVKSALQEISSEIFSFVFEAGEKNKNLNTVQELYKTLIENEMDRKGLLVALGGGVAGDMAGFAAAVYQRGIRFVQVPTTFLAAVDSSVGGKTAIDLRAGKNMAGAFYQPHLVLCDVDTLDTLPEEIFVDGIAETLKYGVIGDASLFAETASGDFKEKLEEIIETCVKMKRDIVNEDEFDTGLRQLLNLGHTLGHSIEKNSNFALSHGHAVAIGMHLIAKVAERRGLAEKGLAETIRQALLHNNLPTSTSYTAEEIAAGVLKDKKRRGGEISFILPTKIGHCEIVKIPTEEVLDLVRTALA